MTIRDYDAANVFLYDRVGHPLHGIPLQAVAEIGALTGYTFYSDPFINYNGPRTAGTDGWWTLTETAAGAGNAQRVDVDDSRRGGWLKMLTDNGNDDIETLEMEGEPWRYVVGKKMWFAIRVEFSDVDGEKFFGLAIADTTPIAGVSDGLYFSKADAATAMSFSATKNSVSTTLSNIDPSALADAVSREYAFYIDETGKISVYVDWVLCGTIAAGNANIVDDEDIHLTLSVQTTTTAAQSMSIDYVLICQQA